RGCPGRAASCDLHPRGEHVAVTADGHDHARRLRIIRELSADAAHLHIDASVEGSRIAAAREVEELVAGEYALRMFGEGDEQFDLAGSETDEHALRRLQPAAPEVELPAGKAELLGVLRGGCSDGDLRAAKHRADAREQFAGTERLGEVIVGAE